MPHFVVPKKSGVHRIAGIALFRALLSSCKTAPLPSEAKTTLGNIIRNKFKRNQDVHSKILLTKAFQAGYEALDLLDAAHSGDVASVDSIRGILEKAVQHLKRSPTVGPLLPPTAKPPKVHKPRPQESILARPYPIVSGKRMVPTLVIANSIPFLRTKKPQPKALSAYIRGRIIQRQKRHDRKEWLYSVIKMADSEDGWDGILANDHGLDRREPALRCKWGTEYRADMARVSDALAEEARRSKDMVTKFNEIIAKEKELVDAEAPERMKQKKARKNVRRILEQPEFQ